MRGGSGPAAPFGGGALADRVHALAARGARHRRLAAALLAAAAVVAAVPALTPSAPSPAAADGPATGTTGSRSAPGGAFDAAAVGAAGAAGRTVVAVRLADPAGLLLAAPGRHVEVLAAAAGNGSGAPSDVVPAGPADVVAADALVVAVPEPPGPGVATGAAGGPLMGVLDGSTGATEGPAGGLTGVVLLAVPPRDVPRLAGGGARALSLALPLPPG